MQQIGGVHVWTHSNNSSCFNTIMPMEWDVLKYILALMPLMGNLVKCLHTSYIYALIWVSNALAGCSLIFQKYAVSVTYPYDQGEIDEVGI